MSQGTPIRRKFVAKVEDRDVPIELEETAPETYRVWIDGDEQTIELRSTGSHLVSVLLDGRQHELSLHRSGEQYDVLIRNARFQFRLLSEEKARRIEAVGGDEIQGRREIRADMPGKVVEVLVSVGDQVESKQGLLVIEAMKMENEIHSPGAGEVKEIHVEAGQPVEAGELLAVVE